MEGGWPATVKVAARPATPGPKSCFCELINSVVFMVFFRGPTCHKLSLLRASWQTQCSAQSRMGNPADLTATEASRQADTLRWLRRWYLMFLLMAMVIVFLVSVTQGKVSGPAALVAGVGSIVLFVFLLACATMWEPKSIGGVIVGGLNVGGVLLIVWWFVPFVGGITSCVAAWILDMRIRARISALKSRASSASAEVECLQNPNSSA